ncbi:MAG: 3-phosphoshikimate 1-carboxyvinyltransferase [Bacteroidota bacterium]
MRFQLFKPDLNIQGEITLNGSKSIANRALIIQALCEKDFEIELLSNSKDTVTLNELIGKMRSADKMSDEPLILDTGAAGTTYRFMTAYLAMQEGTQILTGSERMKQRPIGVLAEALKKLGANIEYLEKDGYPPLKIDSPDKVGTNNQLSISAGTSSQYISALLMIAPTLPDGLELTLEGKIVSIPYIKMTLSLMSYFGVNHTWEGNTISIAPQKYQAKTFKVEADWSAASYYYALAAFSDELDLQLNGLFENSVQGDSVLSEMMQAFGIQTLFNENGVQLLKEDYPPNPTFQYNFLECPDLAQTIAVICGGLGIEARLDGLETLRIKETDRIAALKTELNKVDVIVRLEGDEVMKIEGKAYLSTPTFDTYEDHRMAMAFAPLAMMDTVQINEPMVVVKSYPAYYEDLKKLGFEVKEM